MKKITARLAALLTVVLALTGLGLGALPAHAADPVNASAPVTLNIHKYLGDPTGTPTANPQPGPTGLTGIAGIQFEIYKVTNTDGSAIDLTTQAGWTTVSTLTATNATVGAALATITTDTNGLATISTGTNPAFTVGVYKVVELTKDGYSTIAPFLVTLPYSSTADGTWQYVQDVYPKNQSIRPSKEVWYTQNATPLDATTAVNDVTSVSEALTYRVLAPVPTGTLDRFNIVDTLAQGQTVTGTPVLQYTPDPKVTPLALTTIDPAWYTVAGAPGAVNVTFTAAGLTGLANLRATTPGLNVVLTYQATVPTLPADGKLTNTATLQLPNGGTATTDGDVNADGTFSDPVTTTFAPPDHHEEPGARRCDLPGLQLHRDDARLGRVDQGRPHEAAHAGQRCRGYACHRLHHGGRRHGDGLRPARLVLLHDSQGDDERALLRRRDEGAGGLRA